MLVFDDVVLALQLPKDPNTSAALFRMGATHAADPGGLAKPGAVSTRICPPTVVVRPTMPFTSR